MTDGWDRVWFDEWTARARAVWFYRWANNHTGGPLGGFAALVERYR